MMHRAPLEIREPAPLDAEAELDRLCALRDRALIGQASSPVEVYQRIAVRLGLRRRGGRDAIATQTGWEEGLAVRWVGASGKIGFASGTGAALDRLKDLVVRASHSTDQRGSAGRDWICDREDIRSDLDGADRLPDAERLAQWLDAAWEEVVAGPGIRSRALALHEAGVDVALTLENWVGPSGWTATRRRCRGWAMLRLTERDSGVVRPLQISARRWEELAVRGWSEILEDRLPERHVEDKKPPEKVPVVVNPEDSALLLLALSRALFTPGPSAEPLPVGAGLVLSDVPGDPSALYGGHFDDAGFPTRRTHLADGRTIVGTLAGPGHLLRPSFRDPPAPLATHLELSGPLTDLPPIASLATDLKVHVLTPECWILEIKGVRLEGGGPSGGTWQGWGEVSPAGLARRLAGTIGPPRRSHRSVLTPALIVDGLELEPLL